MKVVVGGATGKLGRMVCERVVASKDMELFGAIVSESGGHAGTELYPGVFARTPKDLTTVLDGADVYVDLTTPDAASGILASIPETGVNIVLGTTAVDPEAIGAMSDNVRKYGTSALVSANFDRVVNVFWKACEILAGYLPGYDIEVIETHHRAKKDAPSGTTMEAVRRLQNVTGIETLVFGREGVTGPRGREIGIHSVRAGGVVGDHTLVIADEDDTLELTHRAIGRDALADGCIASIRWMAGRKDGKVHSMDEVLGL